MLNITAAILVSETRVPFEFIRPGVPLITFEAKVGKAGPFKFILDTGNAGEVLLSERLAEKLNLKKAEEDEDTYGVGKGAKPTFAKTHLDEFTIGDLKIPNIEARVSHAIDELRDKIVSDAEGNIGHDLLKSWAVQIDYQNKQLTFDTDPQAHEGIPFTLAKDAPLIIVRARINGSAPRSFVMDTGAGATVLDAGFAKASNIALGEEIPMLGAAGLEKGHRAKVDSIAIADRKIGKTKIVVAGFLPELSKRIGTRVSGVIGYDFLREFRVRIDYRHLTLNFEPNK